MGFNTILASEVYNAERLHERSKGADGALAEYMFDSLLRELLAALMRDDFKMITALTDNHAHYG